MEIDVWAVLGVSIPAVALLCGYLWTQSNKISSLSERVASLESSLNTYLIMNGRSISFGNEQILTKEDEK